MRFIFLPLFLAACVNAQVPSSTPPMGWNSYFMSEGGNLTPTQAQVETQANAMKSLLGASGYKLVSIDGGWSQRPSGTLVANTTNFPSGMPVLVSYIHGQGQYIGLYSSPGPEQCSSAGPGSYTYETTDANTFAGWGIDYLKYDWCTGASVYPNTTSGMQSAYQIMGTALAATSVPNMYYLVSAPELTYGYGNGWLWFATVGGNEYWTVEVAQEPSLDAAEFTVPWATYQPYQSKGHWLNDDFLVAGRYSVVTSGGDETITDTQGETQFNLFAMLAAPLMVSADITTFNSTVLSYLTNSEVIAVDQDSLGLMGSELSSSTCGSTSCEIWTRTLANGNTAVAFFNRDTAIHSISLTFSTLGHSTYFVRDILAHQNLGFMTSYTTNVPATGSAMLILSDAGQNGGSEVSGFLNGSVIQ
jgi:alpha-galactosidase